MTDMHTIAIFRFFGGNQLIFASNAVYSKGGAAIGYHRRHGSLLNADPRQNKTYRPFKSGRVFFSEAREFLCRTASKRSAAGGICCTAIGSGDLPLRGSRQR